MGRINLKVLEEIEERLRGIEVISIRVIDTETGDLIKEIKPEDDEREPTVRIIIRI